MESWAMALSVIAWLRLGYTEGFPGGRRKDWEKRPLHWIHDALRCSSHKEAKTNDVENTHICNMHRFPTNTPSPPLPSPVVMTLFTAWLVFVSH